METNGYSKNYVGSFKREIINILATARSKDGSSYTDIYLDYTKASHHPDVLPHKRTIIGAIEQFDAHLDADKPRAYIIYSRNTGLHGKMSQTAVNKQLKKHARAAHGKCNEVPVDLHAHQLRHAKASHWLEDGMNIVQISFLLGHQQLQTTTVYIDITLKQELNALSTFEDENDKNVPKKWKNIKRGLAEFCGVKPMKKS